MSLVLCVLDGWGHRDGNQGNAIQQAKTPFWDELLAENPYSLIHASEEYVGLPKMCMGNSEVGHMSIGAGRIVLQDLLRIEASVQDGTLAKHNTLKELGDSLLKTGGTCHVLGLLSDGLVHASHKHMLAIIRIMQGYGVPIAVHAILDGRDTGQKVAGKYIKFLQEQAIEIQTMIGRYYAMDRDKRWDRTQKAHQLFVHGTGEKMDSTLEALEAVYTEHCDEFCPPMAKTSYKGMKESDGLIMTNYRADRARQIISSFLGIGEASTAFPFAYPIVTMTDYSEEITAKVLFTKAEIQNTFSQIISDQGKKQFHIAETEKYAHVTFFFNGRREKQFPGEDRLLIPSPKVKSYDSVPEMSAGEITDALVNAIKGKKYDFILVNYANADMVGHTGDFQSCIKAVEFLDKCLKRVSEAVERVQGNMIITADHGNAEEMLRDGKINKAHTLNRVPIVIVGKTKITLRDEGSLCNIAPTMLDIMNLPIPKEMGKSLLERTS